MRLEGIQVCDLQGRLIVVIYEGRHFVSGQHLHIVKAAQSLSQQGFEFWLMEVMVVGTAVGP